MRKSELRALHELLDRVSAPREDQEGHPLPVNARLEWFIEDTQEYEREVDTAVERLSNRIKAEYGEAGLPGWVFSRFRPLQHPAGLVYGWAKEVSLGPMSTGMLYAWGYRAQACTPYWGWGRDAILAGWRLTQKIHGGYPSGVRGEVSLAWKILDKDSAYDAMEAAEEALADRLQAKREQK